MQVLEQSNIREYPLLSRGKVRDIYEIDNETLLIITTDRMSAFDVVLPDPIPFKGAVLNQLTIFWMEKFKTLVKNHLVETEIENFPSKLKEYKSELEHRSVLARKTSPLPVECIVRGYLSGSGWKDYQKTGKVCGYHLPAGLKESDKLPEPLFTPSTKAEIGGHDENITLDQASELIGGQMLEKIKQLSLNIYQQAIDLAENQGLLIADTKFEFGMQGEELFLIDEVLTPDSSRFWPRSSYKPGTSQPSFDKQYLRDWLLQNWKSEQPPRLPQDVIDQTKSRYLDAYRLLTGKDLLKF